jgi:YVTN family beta-propeller protein
MPRRVIRNHGVLAAAALAAALAAAVPVSAAQPQPVAMGAATAASAAGSSTGLLADGRRLAPQGAQVPLGNLPTGGAVTTDGRFLWTVSAGFGANDVRIVDTAHRRVCQVIPMPGASGGIALDSAHHLAYVSDLPNSRWWPTLNGLPGAGGNAILVYRWTGTCGQASFVRVIAVPPPATSPPNQAFPPVANRTTTGTTNSWPQKLAVSSNGRQLLVALNLADSAALVNLASGASPDRVSYVPTGSYPFGAAISPNGRLGLVSNEAAGTVSAINMRTAVKLADITVGPPLSHPEGIAVDSAGARAYVALSASDEVVVIDLRRLRVERTISVGRSAGLGTMPVALALGPHGERLFVADSGSDELAVIRIPKPSRPMAPSAWTVEGRIPTGDQPQSVVVVAAQAKQRAQLMYVSAKGSGIVGPDLLGPVTTQPLDPIFWAFNPIAPSTDVFGPSSAGTYLPAMIDGRAGLTPLPSDQQVAQMTPVALRQIQPVTAELAPKKTPLRANGPIKHVFFIVRENRSYDQLLGDVSRGNGDPNLTIFGQNVTPNLHALVARFPLLDNVMADSEASIQGHSWTAGASVSDYLNRNWVQQYAARGRPNDFGVFAVSFPGNGFLFDQAERQHISYFNYGEGLADVYSSLPDRNRSAALLAEERRVNAHSDIGPALGLTPGGCYPSDMSIGSSLDNREIFDSTLPAAAPAGSYSHMSCFLQRFEQQLATNTVPTFNYLSMTSDHTRGTQAPFPVPTAMVADSDQAIGQFVSAVSHSKVWSSSAIFIVEDDSQDGADHVDAHRIPVAVISPYARRGAVIHTHYDLVSAVRSMELIMGMKPLSLNDALATPMYDAFTAKPLNGAPVNAIPANVNLLTRNTPAAPWVALSQGLNLARPDQVPQQQLDSILWKSVHGVSSSPPPPGPNASSGE